jgi:hypothetical protein
VERKRGPDRKRHMPRPPISAMTDAPRQSKLPLTCTILCRDHHHRATPTSHPDCRALLITIVALLLRRHHHRSRHRGQARGLCGPEALAAKATGRRNPQERAKRDSSAPEVRQAKRIRPRRACVLHQVGQDQRSPKHSRRRMAYPPLTDCEIVIRVAGDKQAEAGADA